MSMTHIDTPDIRPTKPAVLLPPAIVAFLTELQDEVAAAEEVYHRAVKDNTKAETAATAIRARVKKVKGTGATPSEALLAELDALEQALTAANDRVRSKSEAWRGGINLLTRLRAYAEEHAPLTEVPLPPVPPDQTLAKLKEHLGILRDVIASKQADIRAHHGGAHRPTKAEVTQAIKALVADRGARGRPVLDSNFQPSRHDDPKALDVLAWLFPDAVEKRLLAGITEFGELDAAELKRRLDKDAADLLSLEREEEAIVRALGVPRRPDADARAVLAVE